HHWPATDAVDGTDQLRPELVAIDDHEEASGRRTRRTGSAMVTAALADPLLLAAMTVSPTPPDSRYVVLGVRCSKRRVADSTGAPSNGSTRNTSPTPSSQRAAGTSR